MKVNTATWYLGIALIVFVMLTFVLAATTYFFFGEKIKFEKLAAELEPTRTKLQGEIEAERAETAKLREIIGTQKTKAADAESEATELVQSRFTGFQGDDRSYRKLVDWLDAAVKAKDDLLRKAETEKNDVDRRSDERVRVAESRKSDAEKAREEALAKKDEEKQDFDKRWTGHEQALREVTDARRKALEESERTRTLTEELAKLGPVLAPDKSREFASKSDDPGERLRLVYKDLLEREKTIQKLNQELAKLHVPENFVLSKDARPGRSLQDTVIGATPADDRIEGFDGRVIAVDEASRTALVSVASTVGLRPGLVLRVYDPSDPQPLSVGHKAVLEVVEVEGDTRARARIRSDSVKNQILPGDGVASQFWAPGTPAEILFVGTADLDGDGKADYERLKALAARRGATLVDTLSPSTLLVVDAGYAKDEGKRTKTIDRARQLGIRVVGIDDFFEAIGVSREAITAGRVPRPAAGRPLPRRTGAAAY